MAKVLQCDACKKITDKLDTVVVAGKTSECCASCVARIIGILVPVKRGPKPAESLEPAT